MSVRGLDTTLSISDGAGGFNTVGVLTDVQFEFTEADVDTRAKEDAGEPSKLEGTIMKSLTVTAPFRFADEAVFQDIYDDYAAGTHETYQIDLDKTGSSSGGAIYEAAFRITSLSFDTPMDGAVTGSITLVAAGPITRDP